MAPPSEAVIILPLASPAPTELDSDDDATDEESRGVGESSASWGVVGGDGARGDFVGGVGVPGSSGPASSQLPGSGPASSQLPGLDDSLPDNLMNGSAAYVLSDSQEETILRSLVPRRVVGAVKDVLAASSQQGPAVATIRSPAVLPSGDGLLAVAGMMRATIAPPGVGSLGRIDWRCPAADADPYNHCCQVINEISSAPFYIGITECPERRLEDHDGTGTCGFQPDMVALVEARTSRDTAALERALLRTYRHYPMCHNVSAGGEGASWGSPHFLYVLRASSPLIRRGRR